MGIEFWQGKRVVITGINGLMGGWLARKLVAAKAWVSGIDTGSSDLLYQHPGTRHIPVYRADIRDFPAMRELLAAQDIVFHFAAISGVEHSRELGFEAIDINVRGTYTILEAALRQTPQPIVMVATSNHIYGGSPGGISTEDSPLRQLDTYSASKACGDILTRAYYQNYGLPTAAIRNTNCFGSFDPHSDHIVPGTILAIQRGQKPIIKGTGETRKSYLHVEDVIDAYLLVAELVAEGNKGRAWNVASTPVSVKELVELICKELGWEKGYEVLNQSNDQRNEYLDCTIMKAFGWKPRWTLKAAIQDTATWLKEQQGNVAVAH